LWNHIKKLSLTISKRAYLTGDQNAENFSKTLLQVGDGNVPTCCPDGNTQFLVGVPVNSLTELQLMIFPDLSKNLKDHKWLA